MKLNPEVAEHQKLRLNELRKTEMNPTFEKFWPTSQVHLERAIIVPLVLEAVRADATLGEIMGL